MNELEVIENKFGFKYPALYHQMYANKMLDWFRGWNEPWTRERNWHTEVYPTLINNPPLLLHNSDFEIFETKNISKEIETIPDYWNPQYKLAPIGHTGGGDWYAFWFRDEGDTSVIYAPHDENMATILAKNFQDFIFRMMVEYVSESYGFEDVLENKDESEVRDNLQAMLKSHSPYLSEKQVSILNEKYITNLFANYKTNTVRINFL